MVHARRIDTRSHAQLLVGYVWGSEDRETPWKRLDSTIISTPGPFNAG
jgi:hypothetical protein